MNRPKQIRKVEVLLENHGITYQIPLHVYKTADKM